MKILIISHTYIAPINRDKWKVLAKLYPDAELKVVIPKVWQDALFKLEAGDLEKNNSKNCEFIALKAFKTGNEILYGYYPRALIKILKNFQPDIIHVEQGDNAFSYFQSILFSKIFCRKAKPVFFTWINWKPKLGWKYKLFWKWIEKFNLYSSKGAFVGNSDAGDILKEKGFKKPIKVLPQLGVDLNFFKPEEQKISKERNQIAFIGRFVEEKGIFTLVDAFNLIFKDCVDWDLVFVGGGKSEVELREYVEQLSLENRVKFINSVDHYRVRDILQNVDIMVLPSYDTPLWKEQLGHVIFEAMACKVPVIGSDAGEIPNVISDSGLIFKQKDSNDLAGCLKLLIFDEIFRNIISQKGYERVKKYYSHEAIAKQTYDFWQQI